MLCGDHSKALQSLVGCLGPSGISGLGSGFPGGASLSTASLCTALAQELSQGTPRAEMRAAWDVLKR